MAYQTPSGASASLCLAENSLNRFLVMTCTNALYISIRDTAIAARGNTARKGDCPYAEAAALLDPPVFAGGSGMSYVLRLAVIDVDPWRLRLDINVHGRSPLGGVVQCPER